MDSPQREGKRDRSDTSENQKQQARRRQKFSHKQAPLLFDFHSVTSITPARILLFIGYNVYFCTVAMHVPRLLYTAISSGDFDLRGAVAGLVGATLGI